MDFDVVVIGSGPAGYVAAIRASQLGLKTAVVEREHLGGICLNWGCIPTKALLRSAEVLNLINHSKDYGINVKDVSYDFSAIIARSRAVAKRLSTGVSGLMKKNKIEVIMGSGKLLGNGKIEVSGEKKSTISAKHIILATGARARVLPGLEPDGNLIWTYREALNPNIRPKTLLVVGSGAIGTEFACFFNALGTKVTIVEVQDRILPVEDAEISALAQKAFEKTGIDVKTKTNVVSFKKSKDSVTVQLKDEKSNITEITVDRVIVAAGIVSNIENIGLENTKVVVEKGKIKTNDFGETAEKGIYAVGDITVGPALAHKGSHQGIICVDKIANLPAHPLNMNTIPGCTYTTPQIASVGLTESAAKEKGYSIKVGKFPLLANGKAIALGEDFGMVKTIFDAKTGELLGAHMIGAEVTELIQGYLIAMNSELTENELINTTFPHPTVSESMHESVLVAFGRGIHI